MNYFQELEEGFYPNKLEHKSVQKFKSSLNQKNYFKSHIFNASQSFADVAIKKQPLQSYQIQQNIEIFGQGENEGFRKRQRKLLDHPYNIYMNNSKYILVYSRQNNEPIMNEFHYIKNEVILFDDQKNGNNKYKLLKKFQKSFEIQQKSQLVFDSKFESGNLRCCFRKVPYNEYHCFIDNDTNTLGYNQWFYFSVTNIKPNTKYLFKMLNFKKQKSFFKYGYKPAIFSFKKHQKNQCGWYRDGCKVNYSQSSISTSSFFKFYILSFQLQFQYADDLILIAANLPYSYSKLIHKMDQFRQTFTKNKQVQFKIESICKTLCNNDVPQIRISNKNIKCTKMIIFMARQHPGQTVSSYLIQRIIQSLSQNKQQLKYLLQNYVIIIYPMINIDGVIYGNSRCDISGVDLNRRWRDPSKIFHPQIYQIKKRIINFQKKYKIECCFDLHGHSKLYNSFCYSCKDNFITCRILPYMIQSATKMFYFPSCTFGIARGKQTTARATLYRIIKNQNVLTIQNSYFGYKTNNKIEYWQLSSFDQLANSILISTANFLNKSSDKFNQAQREVKSNLNQLIGYQKHNLEQSGSQSDPSADQIDFQIKINTVFSKKFSQQAKSFIREKEINQVHYTPICFKNDLEDSIQKIHERKQQSCDLIDKQRKIKIKKIKNKVKLLKPEFQIEKIEKIKSFKTKDLNQKTSLKQIKQKRTISYSIKKNYKILTPQKTQRIQEITPKVANAARPMFKNNKRVSLLNFSFNSKQSASQQNLQNLRIISKSKQTQKPINSKQNDDTLRQFYRKFQKFIPSNMNIRNKSKLSNLEESIYKDDQTHILNTLMQNKKKLQQQKIRRQIQLSTCIVQRQGKIKKNGPKDQIVDFKKFKDNQKLKIQMKKVNENYNRYLEDQYRK